MKNRIELIFLAFLLFLTGCREQKLVEFRQITRENHPSISISDSFVKSALELTDGEKGDSASIYFVTPAGKYFIKGRPLRYEHSSDYFESVWLIGGKDVTVSVRKDSGVYLFSFSAKPDNDILKWGFSIGATEEEYFTGLFERVKDGDQTESWKEGIEEGMNLRGQRVEMIIKPTLSLYCPFYLSSNGYGLFIEGTWPGKYDFCNSDSSLVKIEFEGYSLKGRIYTSDSPAAIVRAHSMHVGPSLLPPEWAFLPWRWRDNHTHRKTFYDGTPVQLPYNSELAEDILMMEAFDIPCGVYWVDRPWAKGMHGYADFEWDPERFPDAEGMIEWLHGRDIKFLLWIAPWVTGEMMKEAQQNGYTQPMKETHHSVKSSNAALIDFTNPDACAWWQENGIKKMLLQGVDGFKLDRSEETMTESRDVILADGRTSREVRNEYPVLYVKTVNEICRKIAGDDFILIPRAGYTGSSKYSGFWGGDIGSTPEALRAAIIAVQRSAVIGFPIWGSDIGGYWQGDLDREVCARWLAFGCFNPIMEFGPTEDRAPWNMDSEPKYDKELIAIWRLYAKIHTHLAAYSYGLAREAHETGMPPVRPLFMVYPGQEESWTQWQNFLYGPDILVHAVWEKGINQCKVYLPAGERWRDAWDREKIYNGGQIIQVGVSMHKIPVFIREGSDLDLGDLDALYNESLLKASKPPDLGLLQKNADI